MFKCKSIFRVLECLRSYIILENTLKLKEKYFKLFKKNAVKIKFLHQLMKDYCFTGLKHLV